MISGDMSLFEGKIVQIIQDPVLDDEWRTSVTISDGDKWVVVQVDKYYQAFIKNYVKEFDFIKISNVQGSFQHQNLSLVRKKSFFQLVFNNIDNDSEADCETEVTSARVS